MAVSVETRLFLAMRAVFHGTHLSTTSPTTVYLADLQNTVMGIAHFLTSKELTTLTELLESVDRREHGEEEVPK